VKTHVADAGGPLSLLREMSARLDERRPVKTLKVLTGRHPAL